MARAVKPCCPGCKRRVTFRNPHNRLIGNALAWHKPCWTRNQKETHPT